MSNSFVLLGNFPRPDKFLSLLSYDPKFPYLFSYGNLFSGRIYINIKMVDNVKFYMIRMRKYFQDLNRAVATRNQRIIQEVLSQERGIIQGIKSKPENDQNEILMKVLENEENFPMYELLMKADVPPFPSVVTDVPPRRYQRIEENNRRFWRIYAEKNNLSERIATQIGAPTDIGNIVRTYMGYRRSPRRSRKSPRRSARHSPRRSRRKSRR